MSGFEITCVNKDQRGLIIRVGGVGWSMPIQRAITEIVTGQLRMYIRDDARFFDIGVRGEGSDSYLTLEPDGFPLHELTNLSSC